MFGPEGKPVRNRGAALNKPHWSKIVTTITLLFIDRVNMKKHRLEVYQNVYFSIYEKEFC